MAEASRSIVAAATPSSLPLLEPSLALLALGVTIYLAYRQIKKQRSIAADRATLNFIATHEIHNADWHKIEGVFHDWMREGEPRPWKDLLDAERDRTRKDAVFVYSYLNHFELVAIAIDEGIVSERLYAKWHRTSYVGIWNLAKEFVGELRERRKNPALFVNFEKLADAWALEVKKEKQARLAAAGDSSQEGAKSEHGTFDRCGIRRRRP